MAKATFDTCPHCGGTDTEGGEVNTDGDTAVQEMNCNECEGETWFDVYTAAYREDEYGKRLKA